MKRQAQDNMEDIPTSSKQQRVDKKEVVDSNADFQNQYNRYVHRCPVTLSEFRQYTNVDSLVKEFNRQRYPGHENSKKYFDEQMKRFYLYFYKEPKLRLEPPMDKLQVSADCPPEMKLKLFATIKRKMKIKSPSASKVIATDVDNQNGQNENCKLQNVVHNKECQKKNMEMNAALNNNAPNPASCNKSSEMPSKPSIPVEEQHVLETCPKSIQSTVVAITGNSRTHKSQTENSIQQQQLAAKKPLLDTGQMQNTPAPVDSELVGGNAKSSKRLPVNMEEQMDKPTTATKRRKVDERPTGAVQTDGNHIGSAGKKGPVDSNIDFQNQYNSYVHRCPVTLSEFRQYTNVDSLVKEFNRQHYHGNENSKIYFDEQMRRFYLYFYKEPKLRLKPPMDKVQVSADCPPEMKLKLFATMKRKTKTKSSASIAATTDADHRYGQNESNKLQNVHDKQCQEKTMEMNAALNNNATNPDSWSNKINVVITSHEMEQSTNNQVAGEQIDKPRTPKQAEAERAKTAEASSNKSLEGQTEKRSADQCVEILENVLLNELYPVDELNHSNSSIPPNNNNNSCLGCNISLQAFIDGTNIIQILESKYQSLTIETIFEVYVKFLKNKNGADWWRSSLVMTFSLATLYFSTCKEICDNCKRKLDDTTIVVHPAPVEQNFPESERADEENLQSMETQRVAANQQEGLADFPNPLDVNINVQLVGNPNVPEPDIRENEGAIPIKDSHVDKYSLPTTLSKIQNSDKWYHKFKTKLLHNLEIQQSALNVKMPITLEKFKKASHFEIPLKAMLKEFCGENVELFGRLENDEEIYHKSLYCYYKLYFTSPDVREKYPLKLKLCPASMRKKILSFVNPDGYIEATTDVNAIVENQLPEREALTNCPISANNSNECKTNARNVEGQDVVNSVPNSIVSSSDTQTTTSCQPPHLSTESEDDPSTSTHIKAETLHKNLSAKKSPIKKLKKPQVQYHVTADGCHAEPIAIILNTTIESQQERISKENQSHLDKGNATMTDSKVSNRKSGQKKTGLVTKAAKKVVFNTSAEPDVNTTKSNSTGKETITALPVKSVMPTKEVITSNDPKQSQTIADNKNKSTGKEPHNQVIEDSTAATSSAKKVACETRTPTNNSTTLATSQTTQPRSPKETMDNLNDASTQEVVEKSVKKETTKSLGMKPCPKSKKASLISPSTLQAPQSSKETMDKLNPAPTQEIIEKSVQMQTAKPVSTKPCPISKKASPISPSTLQAPQSSKETMDKLNPAPTQEIIEKSVQMQTAKPVGTKHCPKSKKGSPISPSKYRSVEPADGCYTEPITNILEKPVESQQRSNLNDNQLNLDKGNPMTDSNISNPQSSQKITGLVTHTGKKVVLNTPSLKEPDVVNTTKSNSTAKEPITVSPAKSIKSIPNDQKQTQTTTIAEHDTIMTETLRKDRTVSTMDNENKSTDKETHKQVTEDPTSTTSSANKAANQIKNPTNNSTTLRTSQTTQIQSSKETIDAANQIKTPTNNSTTLATSQISQIQSSKETIDDKLNAAPTPQEVNENSIQRQTAKTVGTRPCPKSKKAYIFLYSKYRSKKPATKSATTSATTSFAETPSTQLSQLNTSIYSDSSLDEEPTNETPNKLSSFLEEAETVSLREMSRVSCGLKQRIVRLINNLSFEEFKTRTKLYHAAEIYNDDHSINYLYNYVLKNKLLWPKGLYIPIKEFCLLLKMHSFTIPDNDSTLLKYISPRFLHWSDLMHNTSFVESVRLFYLKTKNTQLNQAADTSEMEKASREYYNECWNKNSWCLSVPALGTDLLGIVPVQAVQRERTTVNVRQPPSKVVSNVNDNPPSQLQGKKSTDLIDLLDSQEEESPATSAAAVKENSPTNSITVDEKWDLIHHESPLSIRWSSSPDTVLSNRSANDNTNNSLQIPEATHSGQLRYADTTLFSEQPLEDSNSGAVQSQKSDPLEDPMGDDSSDECCVIIPNQEIKTEPMDQHVLRNLLFVLNDDDDTMHCSKISEEIFDLDCSNAEFVLPDDNVNLPPSQLNFDDSNDNLNANFPTNMPATPVCLSSGDSLLQLGQRLPSSGSSNETQQMEKLPTIRQAANVTSIQEKNVNLMGSSESDNSLHLTPVAPAVKEVNTNLNQSANNETFCFMQNAQRFPSSLNETNISGGSSNESTTKVNNEPASRMPITTEPPPPPMVRISVNPNPAATESHVTVKYIPTVVVKADVMVEEREIPIIHDIFSLMQNAQRFPSSLEEANISGESSNESRTNVSNVPASISTAVVKTDAVVGKQMETQIEQETFSLMQNAHAMAEDNAATTKPAEPKPIAKPPVLGSLAKKTSSSAAAGAPSSKRVTKAKVSGRPELVPQLTHNMRPLPLVTTKNPQTERPARMSPILMEPNKFEPGPTSTQIQQQQSNIVAVQEQNFVLPSSNESAAAAATSLRVSQELSTDKTLFDNSSLIRALDNAGGAKPQECLATTNFATIPNVKQSPTQVTTPTAAEKPTAVIIKRNCLYYHVIELHYFASLSPNHVLKYELPTTNYDLPYLEATITCGDIKTKLVSTSFYALVFRWPAALRNDFHAILNDLKEYHYYRFKRTPTPQHDLRVSTLNSLLDNATPFCLAQLSYNQHNSEFSHCMPLLRADVMSEIHRRKPVKPLTQAISVDILENCKALKARIKREYCQNNYLVGNSHEETSIKS
ncbi:uncharacterized protein isoform X2 [Musca autumnalis]|uniref:uncharacterized protein isoform X2 n=1 Tax=Musca autumnalis TaxID=221902 RepID=UPI003CF4C46D